MIDSGEVQRIVDTLVQEQGKGRNLRTYVAALAAIVSFVLVCNVGMAFAMANLTRQTSIQRGVMVVADTGEAVQTMSTEFALDERGVLRASALPGNDSEVWFVSSPRALTVSLLGVFHFDKGRASFYEQQ